MTIQTSNPFSQVMLSRNPTFNIKSTRKFLLGNLKVHCLLSLNTLSWCILFIISMADGSIKTYNKGGIFSSCLVYNVNCNHNSLCFKITFPFSFYNFVLDTVLKSVLIFIFSFCFNTFTFQPRSTKLKVGEGKMLNRLFAICSDKI